MRNFLKNDVIANHVFEDYQWATDFRQDRETDWLRYYQLYKNYVKKSNYPYASNLSIPTATTIVNVQTAYILAALHEASTFVKTLGRTDLGQFTAPAVDAALDYHFRHSINIYNDMALLVRQLCTYGTAIYKLFWDVELGYRSVNVPVFVDNEMDVTSERMEIPTLIRNKPKGYSVDLQTFFADPSGSSLDDARYCGEDLYYPIEDLAEMAARGAIDRKAFAEIVPEEFTGDVNRGIRSRYESVGLPSFQDSPYVVRNRVHVIEYYGYMSSGWRDGMFNSRRKNHKKKLVHYLGAMSGEYGGGPPLTLKAEEIPFNHERFPYVDFRLNPCVGEFYGTGDIENVESLLLEQRDTRNMRLDTMNRFIHRMFKVLAGRVKNEKELFWRPGGIVHLENMGDLEVLDPGRMDPAYFANEDRLRQDIDMATGVNDFVIGQFNSSSGFNDTATGITTIQEAALRRIGEKVNIVQTGIKDMGFLMFNLLGQYNPYGMTVRVMDNENANRYRFVDVSPEALRESYDFVVVNAPSVGTKASRVADMIQLIQLGIQLKQVDPNVNIDFNRFYRSVLREIGVPNPMELIGHPNLNKDLPQLPGSITGEPVQLLSPEEENAIMVERLQFVAPHMNDDHPDHRLMHQAAYNATQNPRAKELLAEHDRGHMELMRMSKEVMTAQLGTIAETEANQRDLERMAYSGAGGNARGVGAQKQENAVKRRASAMAGNF